ncbi:MAG: hypothetical protein C0631_10225 [Sedimenticola sp.]|nr:MAG: hypothetical protein C0631_10225 [Sedimenticola sp.]
MEYHGYHVVRFLQIPPKLFRLPYALWKKTQAIQSTWEGLATMGRLQKKVVTHGSGRMADILKLLSTA